MRGADICVARYRACVHSRCVRCRCACQPQPPGAGPRLSTVCVWLAAPRGAVDIYVPLPIALLPAMRFWSLATTRTGNALLVKAVHVIHLSAALLPPPCCLARPYLHYNIIPIYIIYYISDRLSSSTPGVFYKCFYNHAHRLRLEKLLWIELSRSSNGHFKPLLDPGDRFNSETAARRFQK
jgi:hypothetical protein